MKVIFAQGNPGEQYRSTRHNIGFIILDALATANSATFKNKAKLQADIAEVTLHHQKILLVKPRTFYNETGQSARAITDFYKLDPSLDLLVLHDELALPFGTLRIRTTGSDAGNNGIKSLNSHLGPRYARLRIGIYNEMRDTIKDADFVLSQFTKAESDFLKTIITPQVFRYIEDFCHNKLTVTSSTLGDS